MTLKTRIAEIDSFGVQVQTCYFVPTLRQRVKQPTRAACRFEKLFGRSLHMLVATTQNELHLCSTVSTKYQVVVLRMIVDRFVDRFDRIVVWI